MAHSASTGGRSKRKKKKSSGTTVSRSKKGSKRTRTITRTSGGTTRQISGATRPGTDVAKFRSTGVSTGATPREPEKKGLIQRGLDLAKKVGKEIKSQFSTKNIFGGLVDPKTGDPLGSEETRTALGDVALAGLPIGGIGKAGKTIKSFKDVLKLSSSKQAIAKTKLAKQFPTATKSQLNIAIKKFDSLKADEIVKQLSKKPLISKKAIGAILGISATVATTDVLFTWYALDNIADGLNFLIKDVELGLERGTMTPEKAAELFEEADTAYDLAVSKVNTTARFNPLVFPVKKLITKGAAIKKQQYELNKANVLATLEEGFESEDEKFARIREESQTQFEENQESIRQDKEGRDQAFEESKVAEQSTFEERTLLFEAIRNRNTGNKLSPEEIELLTKFGLSTKTTPRESSLDFGLL